MREEDKGEVKGEGGDKEKAEELPEAIINVQEQDPVGLKHSTCLQENACHCLFFFYAFISFLDPLPAAVVGESRSSEC